MKKLIRNTTVNGVALYLISLTLAGVAIAGGLTTYLFGGVALSVMNVTVRPVLSVLSLPLNLVTLGLFSFFSNAIILYILTVIIPNIKIRAFTFEGFSFAGFVVPDIYFNSFFAYVAAAAVLSLFYSYFEWLTKK